VDARAPNRLTRPPIRKRVGGEPRSPPTPLIER
jgi:hypothetical protein